MNVCVSGMFNMPASLKMSQEFKYLDRVVPVEHMVRQWEVQVFDVKANLSAIL